MTPPDDVLKDVIPVILAGGQGRRLRPLTAARPKPFLRLRGPHTLLQQTVLRVRGMQPPAILSAAPLRERITADMTAIGVKPQQIFLEPEGRNTAPAIAAAAHYFSASGNNPLMLVMPSDHAIGNPGALLDAVRRGILRARQGGIVLFGVKPSRAETGYGYIERGAEESPGIFSVTAFREKPDSATAAEFLRSGRHSWNSGIFLFSAASFLAQLEALSPATFENSRAAVAGAVRLQNAVFLKKELFAACPAAPVDRAVMEKAGNLCVIPVDMEWRDVGRWRELIRHVLRYM